jgi:hypothetical protein
MAAERTPLLLLSGAGLPSWIGGDMRAALPAGTDSAVRACPREHGTTSADCVRQVVDGLPPATADAVGSFLAARPDAEA